MKNNFTKSLLLLICSACLLTTSCSKAAQKIKPVELEIPGGPWSRFDVDFAGTFIYAS